MTTNSPPLETVDLRVFQKPLEGLIRNSECDLERYISQVELTDGEDEIFRGILLLIALRFAINSYRAVCFLLAEVDDHPKRLKEFVVVIPPIVRQITDLWCSLIYILDDFAPRMDEFHWSAWIEIKEHIEKLRARHSSSPDWREHFEQMEELKRTWGKRVPDELKADPSLIAYWPTLYKILKQNTKSHSFLEFIHVSLYDDISAEAHLRPSGLLAAGTFLCKDRLSEGVKRKLEARLFHTYKARLFCQTLVVLLGIISEIEMFRNFPNREQVAKIWSLLSGYNESAKDVYSRRYQSLFT